MLKISEIYTSLVSYSCSKISLVVIPVCFILFTIGFTFNSALLIIFYRYRTKLKTSQVFVTALTILNWIGCVIEFPLLIIYNVTCKWILNKSECVGLSFIMCKYEKFN